MKSLTTIRMDFQKAQQCAAELEEIASEMRTLANSDLSDSLQSLSGAWKGESAALYLRKGELLKDKITASAKNLERTAATIRSTARRTYDAEMRAYRLAVQRKYNK